MNSKIYAVIFSAMILGSSVAQADATRGSTNASTMSAMSGALLLSGTAASIAAASEMVVSSVETVGESVVMVLKDASGAVVASVKLSGKAVEGASIVTGTSVKAIAEATGYSLIAAGKIIAFIPNEIGKSLLYHSAHETRR